MSFKLEDFTEVIRVASTVDLNLVLVGGQACQFYADRYRSQNNAIDDLFPLTSKDVDFFGGPFEAQELSRVLGSPLILSPRKGGMMGLSIGVIQHQGLEIQILGHVHGLGDREVKKAVLIQSFKGIQIPVLHPVLLYEAKIANLFELDQKGRQDGIHARAMEYVLPLFLRDLLKEPEREKEFVKSMERLIDYSISRLGSFSFQNGRVSPFEFVPEMSDRLPSKINNWYMKRLPQWSADLEKRGLHPKTLREKSSK